MEELRRARRPIRQEFDLLHRELEGLLNEEPLQIDVVRVKYKIFIDTYERLSEYDVKILEQLVKEQLSEEEEDQVYAEIRNFKTRAETTRLQKEKLLPSVSSHESVIGGSNTLDGKVRKFKLPTIQMKKFSGELKDWLGFWAQFQKIDEDSHMDGSDKFWYLLQSLEPGTDAYEMVAVYPQSSENYVKVIDALKRQYGNEDLLLQVYLRELLSLVISNVKSKEKITMKTLFLKLDSHLRALKTLNLEKADPATWLFPLVESSLPEKVLYTWQRSSFSSHDGSKDDPPKTRLDLLMSFVEREVEIKQRIDITRNFAEHHYEQNVDARLSKNQNRDKRPEKRAAVPTLHSFHVADERKCVFCDRTNHHSEDCFRARNMSYDDKFKILREKGLCFRCCVKNGGAPPYKKPRIETQSSSSTTTSSSNLECTRDVALQTLNVKIRNGNKERIVRAFIGTGSQRSYLVTSAARALNLRPTGEERVVHSLFGGRRTSTVTHNTYEVEVMSLDDDFHIIMEVREQETICGHIPRATEVDPKIIEELRMRNVTLSDKGLNTLSIELLIGADMYAKLCTGNVLELCCGAVALKTKLGWTLMGNVANSISEDSMANLCLTLSVSDVCITQLWELDVLGIRGPDSYATKETRETEAKAKFIANISRLPNGRYSVKLPWKEGHNWLPTNRPVAFKRLQSASRKLSTEGLFQAYNLIFVEWEKEGFIEKVEVSDYDNDCHYLPHRPVIKMSSLTTPVRPVFDASCRVGKSPSLNDCLVKGVNLILLILDLIQRFREHEVGFVSDIRKAFQMIAGDKADRDYMRFLWWRDPEMKEIVEYRHARVMFGATCSPFILAAVIEHHLLNLPEEELVIGRKLLSTFYVDNCVSSEISRENYWDFRQRSTDIVKRAGMDSRMWLSNVEEIDDKTTQTISVLGLLWNRKTDVLSVNVKEINTPENVTKRIVLSIIQKLFDPIGFICPAVLPMKLLLQKTWINKLKWDETLPEGETRSFKKWCEEVVRLSEIQIPRCFTGGIHNRRLWSLHIFTDASKEAYSAVVFLRTQHQERIYVQLLAAKSRVAPVKKLSIPKLELMGCLIGARLAASVKRALEISEEVLETFWSDSSTALAWIRRNDQWGTFVANRTKEIRMLTKVESWRHVPGVLNPADLPSRGTFPTNLVESKWWEGPQWLHEESDSWPLSEEKVNEIEVLQERKKSAITNGTVVSCSVMSSIKAQHSYAVLVRIVGWVRRFLYNKLKLGTAKRVGALTKKELQEAEFVFIKNIQKEAFSEDQRSKLKGLEVVEDDWGLLRVKTRLIYRDDPMSFKFPLLLPAKEEKVKQLIRDYHRNYCHAGVGFLMAKLRDKYWIIKARRTIKGVISKCYNCRKVSAKNVIPEAAPLPLDRVKNAEVFEVIGVDLAGPLTLKNGSKIWLLIFTCAVYRAVHFELVRSCSTKAYISALSKFIGKYRRPSIIYSDNGTNFRGANNLFRKLDWDAIVKDEPLSPIQFKFNPPTAAWWGGWWERLIRTAKDLLKRTIGKGTLSFNELTSVVHSVAKVMNGRPLTYISENPQDLEPLTPSLFFHPFGSVRFPETEQIDAKALRFRLSYVKKLRDELKGRFLKEYLAYLVNRNPKNPTRQLRVGELVLVGSDQRKRIELPLGRVIQIIPGKDDECRLAKVRIQGGEVVRAVQRLFPLEMDAEDSTEKAVRERGTVTRSGRKVKVPLRFA